MRTLIIIILAIALMLCLFSCSSRSGNRPTGPSYFLKSVILSENVVSVLVDTFPLNGIPDKSFRKNPWLTTSVAGDTIYIELKEGMVTGVFPAHGPSMGPGISAEKIDTPRVDLK